MRYILLLILLAPLHALAGEETPARTLSVGPWRIYRDPDHVIRVTRTDVSKPVSAPVARGATPEGFLFFERKGTWWLFLAGKARIIAGWSKHPTGPYIDHESRSLLDPGGVLVAGALPHDPNRSLIARIPGERVDRLVTSDGIAPLVWPPDGYPVVGAIGTIDSWEKPCENPWPFAGPWRHGASFGERPIITPGADRTIPGHPKGTAWKIEGGILTLRWPRGDAPGGVWIDRCRISMDGRYYLGRNQWQAPIVGDLVRSEFRIQPTSRTLPVSMLPKASVAPEGKFSLWADFEHPRDGYVDLYVVNRTTETVKLPAQDGDIYAKLFSKTEAGVWERAQSHTYSWCGNSYFFEPEIPAGRFLVTHGYYPAKGEERPVRYRLMGDITAVSNEGVGRVSPAIIEASRTDRMALRSAGFTTLVEVALGEVKPRVRDRVDLRTYAVEQLAKRFPDDPRTEPILRHLLSDPNRRVATAARLALE